LKPGEQPTPRAMLEFSALKDKSLLVFFHF
jgi:hypothetical protein